MKLADGSVVAEGLGPATLRAIMDEVGDYYGRYFKTEWHLFDAGAIRAAVSKCTMHHVSMC